MKKVHIIGDGISGKFLKQYLNKKGYLAEILDVYTEEDANNIDWNGDSIYFSPGVRIRPRACAHLPVFSDFDILFADNLKSDFIVITGTSGKTTTSSLLAHILSENKINVHLCGNLGIDIFEKKAAVYVIEMSSFQTECVHFITPTIGVITNLYEDHLNVHRTFMEYAAAKYKIISKNSKYIYLGENCPEVSGNKLPIIEGDIKLQLLKEKITGQKIQNHNVENFKIAASIALTQYNISLNKSIESYKSYLFPLYRETKVYQNEHKIIINNSKCTNILSLQVSLNNYKDITLICCGLLKIDLSNITLDAKNVSKVLIEGPDSDKFVEFFKKINIPYFVYDNLENIIKATKTMNGVILFSPLGTSFDRFSGYLERGAYFDSLLKAEYLDYKDQINYNSKVK